MYNIYVYIYVKVKVVQSCSTFCNPMDCSLSGSSVHGILQARILEWVAIPSSRGSSQPRDPTQVSRTGIAGGFFTIWAIRESHMNVCVYIYVHMYVCTHTHTYICVCVPSSTAGGGHFRVDTSKAAAASSAFPPETWSSLGILQQGGGSHGPWTGVGTAGSCCCKVLSSSWPESHKCGVTVTLCPYPHLPKVFNPGW